MFNNVVVIGCGKMGEMWANSFYNKGCNIEAVVDPDPRDENFYYTVDSDLVSSIEDGEGNIKEADIWVIATPTSEHFRFTKEAIRNEIPMVLLEKPATSSPEETEKLAKMASDSNTTVCVDYIELEHSAVRTAIDDMGSDFNLTQAVHWRSKRAPSVLPYIMDDMVHDFSELMLLYRTTGRDFSNIEVENINNIYSWSESDTDMTSDLENVYDAGASLHLEGDNKEILNLRGGFDDDKERRYFCWVDDYQDKAYFVNTLRREEVSLDDVFSDPGEESKFDPDSDISTFSVKIHGEKNINRIVHNAIEGNLCNEEDFERVFDKVDAEFLVPIDEKVNYPDEEISRKIINGEASPATIQDAVEVEKMIEKVYTNTEDFNDIFKI